MYFEEQYIKRFKHNENALQFYFIFVFFNSKNVQKKLSQGWITQENLTIIWPRKVKERGSLQWTEVRLSR